MLVPTIRRSVPCNLRRIAACVTYRNKTRTKIAQYRDESDLLLAVLPNITARRIYNTESNSKSQITLPMLVDGANAYVPSLVTPLKLLYLSIFKITPYIDKEFDVAEFLKGAKYASTIISKALTNKDFESLTGLVSEDMIQTLKTKIETLSPNQRQLIALNEDDILFYVLSDIIAITGDEHSIQITITCHYLPGLGQKNKTAGMRFTEFSKSLTHLVCNYIFSRKYVNNVGGPWIATFVNHYTA